MRSLEVVVGDLPVDHLRFPMRVVCVHLRCRVYGGFASSSVCVVCVSELSFSVSV